MDSRIPHTFYYKLSPNSNATVMFITSMGVFEMGEMFRILLCSVSLLRDSPKTCLVITNEKVQGGDIRDRGKKCCKQPKILFED